MIQEKSFKFYYHHDGSVLHYLQPPMTPKRFVDEVIGIFTGTQVDGIICHMFCFGDTVPLFKSGIRGAAMVKPEKAASVNTWKAIKNLEAILRMETDIWTEAIEMAHRQGKEFWTAMRFNDAHPGSYGLRSVFGCEHTDYILGHRCGLHDKDNAETCRHLDYSILEVQAHRLGQIEEVCSLYDVDGFELDLTRDVGHFAPGTLEQRTALLTQYLNKIRNLLQRIGEKRGRSIKLGLRIPGTPEICHYAGYDVESWIREGIVEMLTPAVFYDTTCELPYEKWVGMAAGTTCKIFACVTEGVGPGRFATPPREAVRGAALNAWRAGVAGINLFNFHQQLLTGHTEDMALLSELGSPDTLERKDKLYMIAGRGLSYQGQHASIEPYSYPPDPFHVHNHQLPRDIPVEPNGPGVVIRIPVADDIKRVSEEGYLDTIRLRLDLCNVTGQDDIDLAWNNIPINVKDARIQPSLQYPWNWNGLHGHYEVIFDLTGKGCVRKGENEFRLILRSRPEDLALPMRLWALRLEIKYKAFPVKLDCTEK